VPGQIGQDGQNVSESQDGRNRQLGTGQLGQDSGGRAAGAGQPGQDSQEKIHRTGRSAQRGQLTLDRRNLDTGMPQLRPELPTGNV
jgi:hypothetical protein